MKTQNYMERFTMINTNQKKITDRKVKQLLEMELDVTRLKNADGKLEKINMPGWPQPKNKMKIKRFRLLILFVVLLASVLAIVLWATAPDDPDLRIRWQQ